MIDFLARERHFVDHLLPIWEALDPEDRGTFYVASELVERVPGAVAKRPPRSQQLTVTASYRDFKLARDRGRACVLAEHGAGQSYVGCLSGSYIGAADRAGCAAVLVPGPEQAARHAEAHPEVPAFAVGVPKLDRLHRRRRKRSKGATVALSFHWLSRVVQEARGAHAHYRSCFAQLAEQFDVIGHGHPRVIEKLAPDYEAAGIPVVTEFDEVIERAELFVCDNSSAMYEWASLDRPVVVLNAPWFRRDVEHGLRFWRHADLGPQVWGPPALPRAIERALADPPELATRRREIVDAVYVACDGRAAQRAATALRIVAERLASGDLKPKRRTPLTRRASTMEIATKRIFGYDRAGRRVLVAAPGQPIPPGFAGHRQRPEVTTGVRVHEPGVPLEQLMRKTRAQLNELAERNGIADPHKLVDKEAVAKAIRGA